METKSPRNLASVLGDLASVLDEMRTPVFLVAKSNQGSRLTLHVHGGCDLAELRAQAKRALTRSGEPVHISVRAHNLRHLAFPRSLEHWLRRLDVGDVIYDPTMIVTRARSLLQASISLRAALGSVIRGSFFDSDRRTFFVVTRNITDAARTNDLRSKIVTIVNEAANEIAPLPVNVSVVSALPARKLVPVDARSGSLAHRIRQTVGRWLASGTLALTMSAASLPASASFDPTQPRSDALRLQAPVGDLMVTSDFGVLSGLAVFTDGRRPSESTTFASTGLRLYFGDQSQIGGLLQVARKSRKQRCFDPTNPSISWDCPTWSVSPGS